VRQGFLQCTGVAAALWLALADPAYALAECVALASPVSFGSYAPFDAAPVTGSGTVSVRCSLVGLLSIGVQYTIQLSPGSSGSYADRHLVNGARALRYNLYTDGARSSVWGNGSAGTAAVTDGYVLGLLTTTRGYPVYGRIPAGQNVPAGTYNDTILVTVDY
jgi:spore coat protein U-like protein